MYCFVALNAYRFRLTWSKFRFYLAPSMYVDDLGIFL